MNTPQICPAPKYAQNAQSLFLAARIQIKISLFIPYISVRIEESDHIVASFFVVGIGFMVVVGGGWRRVFGGHKQTPI